jgi:hypothetical protein
MENHFQGVPDFPFPSQKRITPIITTSDDWRYSNSAFNISGGITLFQRID